MLLIRIIYVCCIFKSLMTVVAVETDLLSPQVFGLKLNVIQFEDILSEQREILFFHVHICFYTVTNSLTIAVTVVSALCVKTEEESDRFLAVDDYPDGFTVCGLLFHPSCNLFQLLFYIIIIFFTFYHVFSVHLSVSHLSHTATDGQLAVCVLETEIICFCSKVLKLWCLTKNQLNKMILFKTLINQWGT